MTIAVLRITAEASGDWHDKPVRWAVIGPAAEVQKFSTRKAAEKYRVLRRRASDQKSAIDRYVKG